MAKLIGSWQVMVVAWIIAISAVAYQATMAFYAWMPEKFWIEYNDVTPLLPVTTTNTDIIFVSDTNLKRNVILTFNDILYKYKEPENRWIRYDSQESHRLHNIYDPDHVYNRLTQWPFKDGVELPGLYCLESNIELHLPFGIHRSFRHDGCKKGITFEVVE